MDRAVASTGSARDTRRANAGLFAATRDLETAADGTLQSVTEETATDEPAVKRQICTHQPTPQRIDDRNTLAYELQRQVAEIDAINAPQIVAAITALGNDATTSLIGDRTQLVAACQEWVTRNAPSAMGAAPIDLDAPMSPEERHAIGEKLHETVQLTYPHLAGKLVGLLLDMPPRQLRDAAASTDILRPILEDALTTLQAQILAEGADDSDEELSITGVTTVPQFFHAGSHTVP